jgi:hypothetical protein
MQDEFMKEKAAHFAKVIDNLAEVGKGGQAGDYSEPVKYGEGVQIVIPAKMTDATAVEVLTQWVADKKNITRVLKDDYGYRPWDVAAATAHVLAEVFGITTGAGTTASVEIQVDIDKVIYVPWGTISIPHIKAAITIGATDKGDGMGEVGMTMIELPKMFENHARGLNLLIAKRLETHSIYRGKAITSDVPARCTIVWSKSTEAALRGAVINVLEQTERAKERGIDLNRPILWHGEPGNGKTETANIVAQIALENGWSFIQCNGSLREVISTLRYARRQSRHVVLVEDFERLINDASQQDRTDLLEELDGSTSKGSEVLMIATTNFLEDLDNHQAARRRFFKEIYFGPLDTVGVERLLRRTLGGYTAEDAGESISPDEVIGESYPGEYYGAMNYAVVTRALDGWGNSYIRKVEEFAQSIALSHEEPHLTTADMLDAVAAYKPDWEAYLASKGREVPRTFENELKTLVRDATEQVLAEAEVIKTDS